MFVKVATSNVQIKEILNELNIPAGIYMGDDASTTKRGIVYLHPTKGRHWVMLVDQNYFDSYGCAPPNNLLNQIKRSRLIVFIQNIKSKKVIGNAQRFVYVFYILQT